MGEWQRVFTNKLVEQVGLTHTDAMEVMGIVCDIRQVAYMEGYERGWAAAENQGKPTAQPTTPPCDNPLHDIQVEADGRCHWCGAKSKLAELRKLP